MSDSMLAFLFAFFYLGNSIWVAFLVGCLYKGVSGKTPNILGLV